MDSKTTRRNITEDPNFDAYCLYNHERDVDDSVYRLRASEYVWFVGSVMCWCVYV